MSLSAGVLLALSSALCFGVSAVLQRAGARRPTTTWSPNVPVLGPVLRRPVFALGVALDCLGLAGSVVAVRTLPVHVVEALLSSSVAVAAVLASFFLREKLALRRWLAIGILAGSLAIVAGSAGSPTLHTLRGASTALPIALLLPVVALLRHPRALHDLPPFAVGLLSGGCFGFLALSASVMPPVTFPVGPTDVFVAVTLVGWAVAGLVLFWRGVRVATLAPVLVGQTLGESLLPSVVALLLGETWSSGSWALPALAFATVLGAGYLIVAPGPTRPRSDQGPEPSGGRGPPAWSARGCTPPRRRPQPVSSRPGGDVG